MLQKTEAEGGADLAPPFEEINTLHELLEVAIGDFAQVLRDPRYAVNMGCWHRAGSVRCQVCLAGSVIAKTMGAPRSQSVQPPQFAMPCQRRLCALDDLRSGNVMNAYATAFGLDAARAKRDTLTSLGDKWKPELCGDGPSYAQNRKDGYRLLRKLRLMQVDLKAAGV